MPNMNSTFGEKSQGFLKSRSVPHSVEWRRKECCRAEFQFEPVFYRRDLDGNRRTEAACSVTCDAADRCTTYLNHRLCFLLAFHGRDDRLCRHWGCA